MLYFIKCASSGPVKAVFCRKQFQGRVRKQVQGRVRYYNALHVYCATAKLGYLQSGMCYLQY